MSDAGRSLLQDAPKGRRLADAIRDVKNIAADKADVVVDIREASRTRLEMLAHELEPVFAEVPADDPSFDFVISNGEQPRLWIDAVAHVALGRDRRTYRFVRDTRLGRVVLAETADLQTVVDQVTLYIAERMVERQRMIDGDVLPLPRGSLRAKKLRNQESATLAEAFKGVVAFLLGAIVGSGIIYLIISENWAHIISNIFK